MNSSSGGGKPRFLKLRSRWRNLRPRFPMNSRELESCKIRSNKNATDLSTKKHQESMAFEATVEGQQFDEYGAMWISDGLGGVTWQC